MSKTEIIRSILLGFMFGMLYISGMPIELLVMFGILILFFMQFGKKIKPLINEKYDTLPLLCNCPTQFRPILTFIIMFAILIIFKQIIYFSLSYFFGINFNIEEYLNTTEIN
jgi:hypothetical protein